MKNILLILPFVIFLTSCGGSIEDEYRSLVDDAKDYKDETSRKGKAKFNEKVKIRDEYIDSLKGREHSGGCYVKNVFYYESNDFDRLDINSTRSQRDENLPYWSVSCREFKLKEDNQGSTYSFYIHDSFLTKKEKKLLDNIEEGDYLSFSGTIDSVIEPLKFGYWRQDVFSLSFTFTNKVWYNTKPDTKFTEKTIFFD